MQNIRRRSGKLASIDVIIPTDNRRPIRRRGIKKAFEQTLAPHRLIVIDGGSLHNSQETIARDYLQGEYVYQDNAGAAAARNTGPELARAPWAALLESNDVWHQKVFHRLAAAIDATSAKAYICSSDMRRRNFLRGYGTGVVVGPLDTQAIARSLVRLITGITPVRVNQSSISRFRPDVLARKFFDFLLFLSEQKQPVAR